MKRVYFFLMTMSLGCGVCCASALKSSAENDAEAAPDSMQMEALNEVVVSAVKASANAPFAVSNVDAKQLHEFARTGQELPMLLQMTPSVIAAFDNGLGIGTGYMRIRGSADSRINITLDGVPLNSPEDQCVFWANMNSYAASLGNVQIQRGVGTSTNGDGAFGASIALTSQTPSTTPTGDISASYGSYNTFHVEGKGSTGLIGEHLIVDARYGETQTDGYVHHTGSRSGSFYGGLTWFDNGWVVRLKHFGNFERTEQAWNGLDKALFDQGKYRFNSLNEYIDDEGNRVRYPELTIDNFTQQHTMLSGAFRLTDELSLTSTIHYSYGDGYYREFRPDNKLSKFGLTHPQISRTDFIRKKGLTQHTYGALANIEYKNETWEMVGGLSAQRFTGNHFGYLTYAKDLPELLANGPYQYYDSDADKLNATLFAKAAWHWGKGWTAFADLQYRWVDYQTDGINDKFLQNADGSYRNQRLDVDEDFGFFNPKAGVSWRANGHEAYASVAVAQREPSRNNYTDNGGYDAPKAEKLYDYEAGYAFRQPTWSVAANLYFMDYENQLVQTGEVSDIGEALTTNINDSYRMGIEISASWQPLSWLGIEGNVSLSENKIKDFDEVIEDWDDWEGSGYGDGNYDGYRTIHHDDGDLAFSPNIMGNVMLHLSHRAWTATWHTQYVGRQYLDNTGCKDRSLDAYSTSGLNLSYTIDCNNRVLKSMVIGARLSNIFNHHYAPNGGVYSAIQESEGYTEDNRYTAIWLYPMAGFTAMGSISLHF